MNIDETCSCGARFRVDIADIHTTSAVKAVASWRDNHRHEPQEPLSGSNRRSVALGDAGDVNGPQIGAQLASADDVIEGRARYADTAGGRADRETLAKEGDE